METVVADDELSNNFAYIQMSINNIYSHRIMFAISLYCFCSPFLAYQDFDFGLLTHIHICKRNHGCTELFLTITRLVLHTAYVPE